MMNKMKNNLRILVLILVLVLAPVQSFNVQAATKTTSKVTTVTKKLTAKQKAAAKKKAAKAKKTEAKKKAAKATAEAKKKKKKAAEDTAKKAEAAKVNKQAEEEAELEAIRAAHRLAEAELIIARATEDAEIERKAKEKSAAARAAREAANSTEDWEIVVNRTPEEKAADDAKYEIIDYTESMVPFKSATVHLNNWFATQKNTGASQYKNCAVTTAYMGILYSNPNYTGTVEELRNKYAYHDPNEGISPGDVAYIVNKEGGSATYVWTIDLDDVIKLIDKGYIVQVSTRSQGGIDHAVIVYGYEDGGNTLLIADPGNRVDTTEKGVRISKDELQESMIRRGGEEVVAFAPF